MCSLGDARNLRERAYLRGCSWLLLPGSLRHLRGHRIPPSVRASLSDIPIVSTTFEAADPSLHPVLQDLADIIAFEAAAAFTADYYPGLPEVRVPEAHVRRVMAALQREIDREALRRGRPPCLFAGLPWQRQVALAERRRYWFGVYGITPRTWRRGTWSVWKVKPVPIAETPLAGRSSGALAS